MNVLGIDFTFFAVTDMVRSLGFYRDLLGLPVSKLILGGTWAEFDIRPGCLVVSEGDVFTKPGGGTVALAVEDVEAALEDVRAAGVQVHYDYDETPVCFLAIVDDPDDSRVILHHRKSGTVGTP